MGASMFKLRLSAVAAALPGLALISSPAFSQVDTDWESLAATDGVTCYVRYWEDDNGTDVYFGCQNAGSTASVEIRGPMPHLNIPYACANGGVESRSAIQMGRMRSGASAEGEHSNVCRGRGGVESFNSRLRVERS